MNLTVGVNVGVLISVDSGVPVSPNGTMVREVAVCVGLVVSVSLGG